MSSEIVAGYWPVAAIPERKHGEVQATRGEPFSALLRFWLRCICYSKSTRLCICSPCWFYTQLWMKQGDTMLPSILVFTAYRRKMNHLKTLDFDCSCPQCLFALARQNTRYWNLVSAKRRQSLFFSRTRTYKCVSIAMRTAHVCICPLTHPPPSDQGWAAPLGLDAATAMMVTLPTGPGPPIRLEPCPTRGTPV